MTTFPQKEELQMLMVGIALAAVGGIAKVCNPDHPPSIWSVISGAFVGLFSGAVIMLIFYANGWNPILGGAFAGVSGYSSHAFLELMASQLKHKAGQLGLAPSDQKK